MTNEVTASPLTWPAGWKRTTRPINSRFGTNKNPITIAKAISEVLDQLRLMGFPDYMVIISTNLKLKQNGLPYSNQKQPDDAGVSVWFRKYNEDETARRVIALDKYIKVEDNLWAISKTIEAMRGIDRWGGGEILNRTFEGFTALPDLSKESWWSVLGVSQSSAMGVVEHAYKLKRMQFHPDKENGNAEMFMKIQKAYKEYLSVKEQ